VKELKRREFLQWTAGAALGLAVNRTDPMLATAERLAGETPLETAEKDLVFLTASTMAALVRRHKISSGELLTAHLEQIERHNHALNAIVTLDVDRARERAKLADEALSRGEIWGPLHGVPVTIKDALETAGLRTTAGFPPLKDYIPKEDATVVARLRAAGAIILGKTNMPTLAAGYYTDNPVFGMTNNPWNLGYTPGGSTGGGAAAVAAGMSPLEIGSDIAGSIRWPAHCCGLFALKPTEWRVPTTGHIPELPGRPRGVRHQLVLGPLARSVEDLVLALHIIAGPDNKMWEVPPVDLPAERPVSLRGLKVAFVTRFGSVPITRATQDGLDNLARNLSARGAKVEHAEITHFDFESADAMNETLIHAEAPDRPDQPAVTMRTYVDLLAQKDAFTAGIEGFLDRFDVLICPAASRPAFPHTDGAVDQSVDGKMVEYGTAAGWYLTPFSLTGHPAVILPLTRSSEGLPIGVQLVGKRWSEPRLLSIAAAVAKVGGPFVRPPGF